MEFISRDALIAAMNTWVSEKDKPLGQVLKSQGALAEDDEGLLDSLVRRFIEKHDQQCPAEPGGRDHGPRDPARPRADRR